MAQKPNYVGITITCGRCKETIFFPSDCTKRLLSVIKRQVINAYGADIISDASYLGNLLGLEEFINKYEFLYENEE